MELGNVIMTPAWSVLAITGLGLGGALLWWLVRRRQKLVRLPTIRIMRLESRTLPRLVLRPPPWLAFACYLLGVVVLIGYSLRPRSQIFTPFEPNQNKILIFCDLSPSVSAQLGIEDYASQIAALVDSVKDAGRISLVTSYGGSPEPVTNGEEARARIRRLGFHRAGLRLGTAIKRILDAGSDIDRLIIASDRDQHSWTGFNWRYLQDDMNVVFFDLTRTERGAVRNAYINDARYLSAPAAATMDWDVEIAVRGAGAESGEAAAGELSGKLEVMYLGKTLGTFPWKISDGRPRLNVRASWPASLVSGAAKTPSLAGEPLLFHLDVDGGDSLSADNDFRADLTGVKRDVLLISPAAGEQLLADPAQQLEVALAIQGFKIRRFDHITQPAAFATDVPFIIMLGDGRDSLTGIDHYCPRSLQTLRFKARRGVDAVEVADGPVDPAPALAVEAPKVWLLPQTLAADWRGLCNCFARLLHTQSANDAEPAYCANVSSRQQWASLLPSLGAKPVGGEVGDSSHTLAFHAKDRVSGLEVLAFTVPLAPTPAIGLTHASLPILVKDLLTWQGMVVGGTTKTAAGAGNAWPRLEDISDVHAVISPLITPNAGAASVADEAKQTSLHLAASEERWRLSNVPLGESLLVTVDPSELPPRWTVGDGAARQKQLAKKDREDPLPWLKLAAMLLVAAAAVEGGWGVLKAWRQRGATVGTLLLMMLLFTAGAAPAWAKVELALLGYHDGAESLQLQTLAREVVHRTSIELAGKPLRFTAVGPDALAEPWLWVQDLRLVTSAGGALKPDLATWLVRGGFLVVEEGASNEALERLTSTLDGGGRDRGRWQPIPPDHELMRSFYLLEALPGCGAAIWRGYEFDGRLAILVLPASLIAAMRDHTPTAYCSGGKERLDQERGVRIFINLVMVALATDYKKDQIHLPEILKRLR